MSQVINYILLYDRGNEYTDVTGGWTFLNYYANTINYSKANNQLYWQKSDYYWAGPTTISNVITDDIKSICINVLSMSGDYGLYVVGAKSNTVNVPNNIPYPTSDWLTKIGDNIDRSGGFKNSNITTIQSSYRRLAFCGEKNFKAAINFVALMKQDDISGLSQYGNDIATILANSSSLLADEDAIDYMLENCTGNFMSNSIYNSTFVNALKSSSYYNKILDNEHWRLFLQFVGIGQNNISLEDNPLIKELQDDVSLIANFEKKPNRKKYIIAS